MSAGVVAPPQGFAPEAPPPAPQRPLPPSGDAGAAVAAPVTGVTLTSVASALSAGAAGFVAGGIFTGNSAPAFGLGAAVLGAAIPWLSYRVRQTALVQALAFPALIAAAAVAGLVGTTSGGLGALGGLIAEALRAGGIAQPPIAFDPGWRFILVAGVGILAAGSTAVALGFDRARLAVFIPVPLVFGGLVAESSQTAVLPTVVALAMIVAALAVSYGADLAREGVGGHAFELRRLARGGAAVVVLVMLVAGLTQVGFLFPAAATSQVVPPQRPQPAPLEADRELFTVSSTEHLALRVAVLDVYDGHGWLTPPFDTGRLVTLPDDGAVPGRGGGTPSVHVTFHVTDLGGHLLPDVAAVSRVRSSGFRVQFDPRTQTLRLPEQRASRGMTYTVEAEPPPSGQDLVKAPPPPSRLRPFMDVPPPPQEVSDLIQQAPAGDLFTRLQFVRTRFYEKVVASGAGQPADISPDRVAALLDGHPGTPYEISAAEALLARWVGVPSRVGYGYYGGTEHGGQVSIHPRDGATWLEVYFEGHGWVPLVGVPPRAQASLNNSQKKHNPAVQPSENLTLPVFIPVRLETNQGAYLLAQYWLVRVVPALLALVLLAWIYPWPVKAWRSARRGRWAARRGPGAALAAAYAEFRDGAHDFNIGHPSQTPLEFLRETEADAEHEELAWLVTRGLWGDLARDLRPEDAASGVQMARSLRTRLLRAQPAWSRLLAAASRQSLRDPYLPELPNPWPRRDGRDRPRRHSRRRPRRRGRGVVALLRGVIAAASLVLMTSCGDAPDLARSGAAALPTRLAPDSVDGLHFQREPASERRFGEAGADSLVAGGRVLSIRRGDEVVGALQVGAFKPSLRSRRREVRAGVVDGLGGRLFQLQRLGDNLVYVEREGENLIYLWFPPTGDYYELFIVANTLDSAPDLVARVLDFQLGTVTGGPVERPRDPRRGIGG